MRKKTPNVGTREMKKYFTRFVPNQGLVKTAFVVSREMGGGIYQKSFAQALDAYVKLPCIETAVNLSVEFPELSSMTILASDLVSYNRIKHIDPDDYVSFAMLIARRIQLVEQIRSFVMTHALDGNVQIGFGSIVVKC